MALLLGFTVTLALGLAEGNNFPPVENPVPIPTTAVKAFPGSEPGFLDGSESFYPIPNEDTFNQRWFTETEGTYLPAASSQEEAEKEDSLEMMEKVVDRGGIGPVATPSPDEVFSRSDGSPQFILNPVVVPAAEFWAPSKNPYSPYTVQRVVAVPDGISKSGLVGTVIRPVPVNNKNSAVVPVAARFEKTIPVRQEVITTSKNTLPLQTVIQVSDPRKYKQSGVPITIGKSVGVQPVKGTEIITPAAPKTGAVVKDRVGVPKSPVVVANTAKNIPSFPLISSPKSIDVSPINTYIITSNGYVSEVRPVNVPVAGKGISIPETVVAKTIGPVAGNIKPVGAVQVPNGYSIGNTWLLRQDGKIPYFQNLRTLLPAVTASYPKTSFSTAQLKNPSLTPVRPFQIGPLVYRRGSKESKAITSSAVVLPHSPKSDVLVIGKGATAAHLQPQKVAPSPVVAQTSPPSKIPCPTPAFQQVFPYITATSPFVSVPGKTASFSGKAPQIPSAVQANRAYPYLLWNPNLRSDLYYLQPGQKRTPLPVNPVGRPAAPIYARNPLQYPYTVVNPYSLGGTAGYYGYPAVRPEGGRVVNKAPPPIPEVSSSSQTSSEESTAGGGGSSGESSKEAKTSAEEPSSKESKESGSAEEETQQINTFAEAPQEAQPSEPRPTYATRTPKPSEVPKPYAFGFDEKDEQGTLQFRQESSDVNGVVTGSYGYRDPEGLYRKVDYIADDNGYRVTVKVDSQSTEASTTSITEASPSGTNGQRYDFFSTYNNYPDTPRTYQ